MKRIYGVVAATVIALTAMPALAQHKQRGKEPPPAAPQWDKEPDAVFGIRLGGDVNQPILQACPPMPSKGFYDTEPADLCYLPDEYSSGARGRLFGTPDLGFWYSASTQNFSNRVLSIGLSAKQRQFETILAVLKERYGEPTKIENMEVVAGSGARLNSRVATWQGRRISIIAVERVGNVNDSYVRFEDEELAAAKAAASDSKVKGAASKL